MLSSVNGPLEYEATGVCEQYSPKCDDEDVVRYQDVRLIYGSDYVGEV